MWKEIVGDDTAVGTEAAVESTKSDTIGLEIKNDDLC